MSTTEARGGALPLPFSKDLWQSLQTQTRDIRLYGMGNGADKLLAVCGKKGIRISGIFASDGFVAVQAHKNGLYSLHMPGTGEVKDVLTGERVGSGGCLDIDFRMGEVRLLEQSEKP